MTLKNILILATLLITTLSMIGCREKKVDACEDPNCEDPSCAVEETKFVTTKRELEPQNICPVMGASIDKSIFVDKNNLRIYVSEESAKKEVTDNFEKYVEELKGMGQKPEIIQ